jgi:hypothetical protein
VMEYGTFLLIPTRSGVRIRASRKGTRRFMAEIQTAAGGECKRGLAGEERQMLTNGCRFGSL